MGQNRGHNLRNAELVWMDYLAGMGWVMERLIELVQRSNLNRFGFDLREFAESPLVASYKASSAGHFTWYSDIGGPIGRKTQTHVGPTVERSWRV